MAKAKAKLIQDKLSALYEQQKQIESQIAAVHAEQDAMEADQKLVKQIKDEYASLVKEHDALVSKKVEVVFNLPVKITFKPCFGKMPENGLYNLYNYNDYDDYTWDYSYEAKLDGTHTQLGIDRLQHKLLNQGLKLVMQEACEEVLHLMPEKEKKKMQQIEKDLKALGKKIEKEATEVELKVLKLI